MKKHNKNLARAIKNAHAQGAGQKRIAAMLNVSRTTVRRVLAGNDKAGTRIATRAPVIAAVKNSGLRTRSVVKRPPQMRELDAALHRRIKEKCRAYGYEICARWWMTTPAELEAHVMSRSNDDAAKLIRQISALGIPELQLNAAFLALLTSPHTLESHA